MKKKIGTHWQKKEGPRVASPVLVGRGPLKARLERRRRRSISVAGAAVSWIRWPEP